MFGGRVIGRLALVMLLLAPPALAEEPNAAARAEAGERFERGVKLYRSGDYAAALVEFEAAWRVVPRFEVLLDVGMAERRLFRYGEAERSLRRYLDEGGAAVPPDRRAEVERELAEIRSLVGEVTVRVEGAPAEVSVDGRAIGRSPLDGALLLSGGHHVIRATRSGEEPDEQAVEVVSGAHVEVALAPRPAPKAIARLQVRSQPRGAEIAIDGRAVGREPWNGALDPGGHLLGATLAGHHPVRAEIVLTAGQSRDFTVELSPLPAARPIPRWYKRWYVWTALALVVAAGAAAGATAWAASRPPVLTGPY